jgi:hypothetical protein
MLVAILARCVSDAAPAKAAAVFRCNARLSGAWLAAGLSAILMNVKAASEPALLERFEPISSTVAA